MDIIGTKQVMVEIPVPTGRKVKGKIVELKLSEKFEHVISLSVEFQQYKAKSPDGKKEFTKKAFYSIGVNWSEKNKGGRLLYSLYGKFPTKEQINWNQALMGKEVDCIFEDTFDELTGTPKGQKIKWIGKPGEDEFDKAHDVPTIQLTEEELQPDENVPF